jgi:hypothetical protein
VLCGEVCQDAGDVIVRIDTGIRSVNRVIEQIVSKDVSCSVKVRLGSEIESVRNWGSQE